MEKVQMRPAYVWMCESCGRDHFEYMIEIDFENEDADLLEELLEEHDGELPEGIIGKLPGEVYCQYCDIEYETEV